MSTATGKISNRRGEAFEPAAAKDELRKEALRSGALVVGVADAAAFADAPEGHRPVDLLPGARAVVVLGGGSPRAGDWRSPLHEHQETMGTSDRINSIGLKIAKAIEERLGFYALFVPPGMNKGNQPFLSVQYAAELAGCGSPSLAGPVLHPEYGMLYYAAIVTTFPFPVDGRSAEQACPAPQCVEMWQREGTTPCLRVCPIENGGCLGGEIEGGGFRNRRYDAARCTARVYTHWIPGFQKSLEAVLDEKDPERRKMILYGSFFTRTLWAMTYSAQSQAQCYECIRVCPVGSAHRAKL